MSGELSTAHWRRLRLAILERDGYLCKINGPHCQTKADCVDHIIARVEGGAVYDPLNCRAACTPCNAGRDRRWVNDHLDTDRRWNTKPARPTPTPSRDW